MTPEFEQIVRRRVRAALDAGVQGNERRLVEREWASQATPFGCLRAQDFDRWLGGLRRLPTRSA